MLIMGLQQNVSPCHLKTYCYNSLRQHLSFKAMEAFISLSRTHTIGPWGCLGWGFINVFKGLLKQNDFDCSQSHFFLFILTFNSMCPTVLWQSTRQLEVCLIIGFRLFTGSEVPRSWSRYQQSCYKNCEPIRILLISCLCDEHPIPLFMGDILILPWAFAPQTLWYFTLELKKKTIYHES